MTDEPPTETEWPVTDRPLGDPADDRPAAIYLFVADSGNRRVLSEWLTDQDAYRVVDPDRPFLESEFDLCIVDGEALQKHRATLERAKVETAPVLLPVLLLLPERRSDVIDADGGAIADNVFATTVDEILSMPIRQAELDWRLKALLRLRNQSLELETNATSLRQFRRAVEASGHAIFITDSEGTIRYANEAFEDVTGYSPSAAIGETPRILNSGTMPAEYFAELWATITGGETWEEQVVNERRDGVVYTAHQTIAPITENGDVQAFVAIQTDITDLKNRTQQLGVIDTILRHNLRNYLTSVRGTAALIADQTSGDVQEFAERIVSDADDLLVTGEKSRAITDVLSEEPRILAVDMRRAVFAAVETVSTEYRDVQIDVELPDQVVATATDRIEEAIEELLRNAIVHTDQDEPAVTIRGWTDDETVRISVNDTGPGLTEMDRDVLESGRALDDLHHGSGLGLWLVYWIVTRSGGSVDVEDREPRGTRVTIELSRGTAESD